MSTSPSTGYVPPQPPGQPNRSHRRLLLAIVLVAQAVFGIVSYFLYDGTVRATRLANDRSEANYADNRILITCSSNNYNSTSLPSNVTWGVSNPSGYSVDATWFVTIYYPQAQVSLYSWQSFHIPAAGLAHPRWEYAMTQQMISMYNAASNKSYTVGFYAKDMLHGTYGDYNFTWFDTYDSLDHLSLTQRLSWLGRLPNC